MLSFLYLFIKKKKKRFPAWCSGVPCILGDCGRCIEGLSLQHTGPLHSVLTL